MNFVKCSNCGANYIFGNVCTCKLPQTLESAVEQLAKALELDRRSSPYHVIDVKVVGNVLTVTLNNMMTVILTVTTP